MGLQAGDVLPLKENLPGGWRQGATQNVEKGTFPSTVGADDGRQLARRKANRHIRKRLEMTEVTAEVAHFHEGCLAHGRSPCSRPRRCN